MHILFITDNFVPEVNAPANRTYEHCREWVKKGVSVTVVTSAPNFPKGILFPGYRNRLWQRESIDGIKVLRVWTFISANEGFFKRIIDHISFMFSSFIISFFVRKVDVVIGTSPQFFSVCSAFLVSIFKRVPFVFELRDLWPESIRSLGVIQEGIAYRILNSLELFLYKRAALIISLTDSFKANLVGRGIDNNKVQVVTNGVVIDEFRPSEKDTEIKQFYNIEKSFTVGYVGTMGLAHSLETVLLAAKKMQEDYPDEDVHFLLIGEGARKAYLLNLCRALHIENVSFVDLVDRNEIKRFWSILDASIVHLKNEKLFETVIPSKIFESMAMSVPILHGVKGESAKIVNDCGVGITFEPENEEDLVQKIKNLKSQKKLYARLKTNGPISANKYCRYKLALKLLDKIISIM